ncbi:MAG: DUF3365 domain-containing protein [Pseudomonadota bacterium]
MKKIMTAALLCAMPLSASFAGDDAKKYAVESKAVVKEFFGQLKGELGKSMKASGPVATIEVCSKSAPSIAKALSEKHGMKVARTSLKTRNSANAPDTWEKTVLKKFEERLAAGENPANMAHFEIIEESGKKNFRFMKAIGMPPLAKMPCLKCHGENIDPKITAKLDELYPEDKARGYKVGQIRGAFTITKPLN